MKLGAALVTLLAIAVFSASPARAQSADPHDLAAILACLNAKDPAEAAPERCLKIVASPCFKDDEAAASPGEIVQCFGREQRVWDQLLNEAYQQLRAKLDETQQAKLRDLQRAWVADRKLSCDFFYDLFQGSMAYPMIASCMNRETARRAIFLRLFEEDAEAAK
jgi:uncharacterized protein YecT (DUF1311 family)